MFRPVIRSIVALVLSFSFCTNAMANEKVITGFENNSAKSQLEIEKKFDSFLQRDNLREWMKRLAGRPHHVGTAHDKDNAEFMLSLFKSWGYEAQLEEFQVLFPTPKFRLLEMTAPEKFTAKLQEPPLKEDSTSNQLSEQLPTYNAYSVDGDVTGQLVYVNYGVPADYEELERRGIDVKGKIVISRYGGSWRGIKPKVAAEHGAIGCLIFSDPENDGYCQGDTYPKGAWRHEHGVQRGSVADMPLYPGDPLTPNEPSTKNAKRLPIKDAPTLTKIPVIPISYADALPLLKAMSGPIGPDTWRGGLSVPYHLGPGPATVHLKLEFNWEIKTIRNVIAKMKGSEFPDQWVIRGNHHDAWVNGAADPISGLVSELEEARAIGELAKTGWKPKRTIVYCAWDGEEPGLLGSTEWVELHKKLLQKNGVLYINTDTNGRGFLNMSGSHTLEKFINEVARDVVDPLKNIPVLDRSRALAIFSGNREARERQDLRIGALGSGSDFTPFLQHAGIASLNLGFGGESGGGSYHSVYDSFDNYVRFIDPNFDYGIALSQVGGHAVLRASGADILPFEFTNYTDTIGGYVREVSRLTDTMREEAKERNWRINNGVFSAVFDPTKPYTMPKPAEPVPEINFAPLNEALKKLQDCTGKYQSAMTKSGFPTDSMKRQQLNEILMNVERVMLRDEGLPRRPWYKHQIYAPGFYTGYGVKTLPSVREAIEQRNWKEATEQISIVAKTIENVAMEIEKATALF